MAPTDLDPFTAHGGRIEAARAMFGGEGWIDLSTGIAPWAYPVGEVAYGRLPDPDALAALEALARSAFGVPAGREVVAVPGTDLALRLLAELIPARRVAVVRPGYAGHAAAWSGTIGVSGDEIRMVDANLIVLANPNNPDGRVFHRATLRGLAARATLIVDEAFADADPRESVADADEEQLIVLRSFGKFYGLPGLRLGFVIASRGISAALRAMLGDWPVSTPAIAIGTAAYADRAWRDAQRRRIAEANDRLDIARTNFPIVGGTSLFRLIEVPDAYVLFRHLASRAILARPFADRQDRLRLGLPRDLIAADRLAEALEEFQS
ncbi:pyridoxal phosphate-dependent class II aminotransferase [Sphingomonas sp. CGMCC 1.13654]|uniref:Aminotransferase n=1 Tax=Sphingomonas chungangi TaxID=2683589 RepID=A0A838L1V0_9SPHN|nr:aminotransferase class I/II-fold pyridoxal phosphate-dependent enzyme [Sphingomonas chungangi]MBA2932635.1 pyridoxal phosphate-dependent class II aminotransferase [Sphingomonas chungangi]MVW56258.1 aminotransferase class I/II-fold pyridoxal phosphate-dependent enzyme [Sphingomonas chungangi]